MTSSPKISSVSSSDDNAKKLRFPGEFPGEPDNSFTFFSAFMVFWTASSLNT